MSPQTLPDAASVAAKRVPGRARRRRDATTGLLFVAPMLVLFLMFRAFPTLGAIGLSFTQYRINGTWKFVGVQNYATFFSSEVGLNALKTTLLYAVIYVPMMLVVALGVALLLHRVVFGSGLFRSLMFLPYVTSFVLAGIIWVWLLGPDGPINAVLVAVASAPIPFLSGAQPLILTSIAAASVWHGYGYSMLILLAGLKSIPAELYESARIDGASAWNQFWSLTLPLLRPSLFFVLVIETIAAFQVFDTAYVMTGGGPARASYSLVYYLYDSAFKFLDFGYAAAVGVVLFLIVLAISLVQRFVVDREDA